MARIDQTKERVARVLARAAIKVARRAIRPHSRTLAKAVKIEFRPDGAALVIPHYWALYVHDGRGAIAKPSGFLIYYRNPAQDPRFAGRQTPERAREVRRLTSREFREAGRLNRAARKRGRPLPVIIVRAVGPVRKGATNFFLNNAGMLPFKLEYPALARHRVEKDFLAFLRPIFKPGVVEKRTLRIR